MCDTYCKHDEMMGFCEICEPPCSVCKESYARCDCCKTIDLPYDPNYQIQAQVAIDFFEKLERKGR